MLRRDMFRSALVGAGAFFGLAQARAETVATSEKLKVAYHLTDFEKVGFVLGAIRNHYEGTDGAVEIELVVHGPALSAFKEGGASSAIASRFSGLIKTGLQAHACANTMRGMDVALPDLLSGFHAAEAGGVVKLAELQRQGYVYLRP